MLRSPIQPRIVLPLSGTFLTVDCLSKPTHSTELLPTALVELGRLVHDLLARPNPTARPGKRRARRR